MIPLRLYHIAVVDMDDWFRGGNAANIPQVVCQRFLRNPTRQMIRKPIHRVPLFRILLKPLADLRQQITFGCHNSISHISGKLRFVGRKVSWKFLWKIENFPFHFVSICDRIGHGRVRSFLFGLLFCSDSIIPQIWANFFLFYTIFSCLVGFWPVDNLEG